MLLGEEFAVGGELGLGSGVFELFGNDSVLAEALDDEGRELDLLHLH